MIQLDASSWKAAVSELWERFPALAERVLTPLGRIAPGFVLVVNDEVVQRGELPESLRPDDELGLIVQVSGGTAA